MGSPYRVCRTEEISVLGRSFTVEVVEFPFREGVELRCEVEGELLRFSDRQLGEREAFRLLTEEIEELLKEKQYDP